MRQRSTFTLGLVISLFHLLFQSALGQYAVSRSVFGNGGAVLSGNTHRIVGTLGQPLIGVVSSSVYINAVGFWYQCGDLVASVERISNDLPTEYRLEQNYPNPFNPSTVIVFALPEKSHVSIKLYNLLGQEVAPIVEGDFLPGAHRVEWTAESLASGIYFYQMVASGGKNGRTFINVKKLAYLR
jgi:hypothetical protein